MKKFLVDGVEVTRPLVEVNVVLTESEYKTLSKDKPITIDGTMNNVVREKLGLQSRAVGHRSLGEKYQLLSETDYLEMESMK
jgi:hypothetical protein